MNNPLNLSNSELLSAYLDGELSPHSEKQLFEKLAANDELRSEMRDLLAIRHEIETGAMYYPPAALKTAAMAKVGLENAGAAGVFASALPYLQKAFVPVASALVGSLLTVLVFMNLAPDADSFKKEKSTGNTFKNDAVKSEIPANVNLSGREGAMANGLKMNSRLRSNDNSGVISRELLTRKERFRASRNDKFSSVDLNKNELLKTASIENNSFKNLAISPIPANNFLKENTLQNTFKSSENPASLKEVLKTFEDEFTDTGILPEKKSWLDDMQFEIRGYSLANYPPPRTLPQTDPIFKNMAVGAYYTLNAAHAIGGEFGQEAFSQKFDGMEEDSIHVNYQQYLVLPWGGISYRYTPDISFKNIRPLGGIMLGGSEGGPVGRAILGVQIFPENAVSMTLGAEAAVLGYRYQGKWFASPKFGLMYGVAVKF